MIDNGPIPTSNICKQGTVLGAYVRLRAILGEPLSTTSDPGKIHVEWEFQTPFGSVNVFDYGDIHTCRRGCRRNPAHRMYADSYQAWSVHAAAADAPRWLASHEGVVFVADGESISDGWRELHPDQAPADHELAAGQTTR